MGLIVFSLDTLKELDNGKPAVAFRHAVENCVNDCMDRPTEKRPRKVVLELTMTPIPEEDPEVSGKFRACAVTAEFKIKATNPNRQTRPYSFGLDRNGRLFFSQESPTNVNQTTFEEMDGEGHVYREVKDVE